MEKAGRFPWVVVSSILFCLEIPTLFSFSLWLISDCQRPLSPAPTAGGAPSTSDIAPSSSWRPPGHQSTGLDQSTGTLAVRGEEGCPSLETWTWPLWRRKHAQTPQAAEGHSISEPQWESGHGRPHPTPLACWCLLLPVMLTADPELPVSTSCSTRFGSRP